MSRRANPQASPDLAAVLQAIDAMVDEPGGDAESAAPDRRDGRVYRISDKLRLALKLAIVTRRPLLLRGDPGSGKSSLAAYVARNLGWRYYEHVVSSRTQARDLLWTYDTVRRFADAASAAREGRDLVDFDYVEPGVLWWVMNAATAERRGALDGVALRSPAIDPNDAVNRPRGGSDAVVLLDEIDKADPDVPNALLVPLGSTEFVVTETDTIVRPPSGDAGAGEKRPRMLVIVTTNEERELPDAFVRRCIVHRLEHPGTDELVEIARAHLEISGVALEADEEASVRRLAERVDVLRTESLAQGRRPPSTAEYLDAVFAARTLDLSDADWELVDRLVLDKDRAEDEAGRQEAAEL
jgi:MoxR-like ATPase